VSINECIIPGGDQSRQKKSIYYCIYNNNYIHIAYRETSIYHSQIIRFPISVVQFLWSLSESYFNYGSCIYRFPGSIVSFSDLRQKR
jgi:hypothetical protein